MLRGHVFASTAKFLHANPTTHPQVANAIFAFTWSVYFNKLSPGAASPVAPEDIFTMTWLPRFRRWTLYRNSIMVEEGGGGECKPREYHSTTRSFTTTGFRVVPTDGDETQGRHSMVNGES